MSQKRPPPRDRSFRPKADEAAPSKPKKKFFSRDNVSKIILPSLVLIAIILTPIFLEVFDVRHQRLDDVIDTPDQLGWPPDIFGGDNPYGTISPDNDTIDDFMEGFTQGLSDPDREMFRYSPTSDKLDFRLEVYDTYNLDSWDKNYTTDVYDGYSSVPAYSDGEFTVTADYNYSGGYLTRYFPAPYHYEYNEEFSSNYGFSPAGEWLDATSSLQKDEYGVNVISTQFVDSTGLTSISYDVSYTLQDNDNIRDSSSGFTDLNTHITNDPDLDNTYLQLPTDYTTTSPYTTQIASNLLDPSVTIFQQTFRNIIWLTNNCTYDIAMLLGLSDDSPVPGQDYVEWFLSRRSGTAAHFAASLAIISRLQGIPSRMVFGFSFGEDLGSEFVIRAKNVHSWVEIFVPFSSSEGYWVAFDPSPLVPSYIEPDVREEYGANTIGFESAFYCTNEFFLEPHLYVTSPTYPYFTPNPASEAWVQDPFNPSVYYGPYVNRTQEFSIYAYLALGTDEEFFSYFLSGIPGNLEFIEGETVTFVDTTTGEELGTAVTNSTGVAVLNYTYPPSSPSGLHVIAAKWLGITVETFNLLTFNPSSFPPTFEPSGVIVSASANITSIDSHQFGTFTEIKNDSPLLFSQSFIVIDYSPIRQVYVFTFDDKKFI
ncbi:MAG: transglutaminase domain-containing protein [Asgard group archaeon]|nr:transglutaminase domain-containing protein [Asgard group archaeon]